MRKRRCITITPHPEVLRRLEELHESGLYGLTLTAVAESLMLQALRDIEQSLRGSKVRGESR